MVEILKCLVLGSLYILKLLQALTALVNVDFIYQYLYYLKLKLRNFSAFINSF